MNYEELLFDWVRNMDIDAQKETCIQSGLIEEELKTDTNIGVLIQQYKSMRNNTDSLEKLIREMKSKKGFLFTDDFCKSKIESNLSLFKLLVAFRSELG